MTNVETEWMMLERPTSATLEAAKSFFGVPPDPDEKLLENIGRKRRRWHSRSNGPSGSEKARQVKEVIRRLEEFLLKGGAFPAEVVDGTIPSHSTKVALPLDFGSLDELEMLIENLTQRGEFERAIATASEGIRRWPEVLGVQVLFCYVVALAATSGNTPPHETVFDAIRIGEIVTNADPLSIVGWWTRSNLLACAGRVDELLYLENEIVSRLGMIPPTVMLVIANAVAFHQNMWRGLEMVMRSIECDPTDAGLRQEGVSIVLEVARRHLPLGSNEHVVNYQRIVQVAAYCAMGVPSLEAAVRPHRMWADRAEKPIFVGGQRLRSFMTIATFFAWLPIHNRQKSKLGWRLLFDGPDVGQAEFFTLSELPYIRQVHDRVPMPWAPGLENWPVRPARDDFN